MQQPVEVIRIQYQLPAAARSTLGAWQPNEVTNFPVDRTMQDRRNSRELAAKAAAGAFARRAA